MTAPLGDELSLRERIVLSLVADGVQTREIMTRVNITQYTLVTTKKSIQRKLGARNSPNMVKIACDRGLI